MTCYAWQDRKSPDKRSSALQSRRPTEALRISFAIAAAIIFFARGHEFTHKVRVLNTGQNALEYLCQGQRHSDTPKG